MGRLVKIQTEEEAEAQKAAKTAVYNINKADRPLSLEEEEAEAKATRYSVKDYPAIKPLPGTLAFLFRNLPGGNETVIRYLEQATVSNSAKFAKNFILLWGTMDNHSKKRIDIFDLLCRKFHVAYKKFWGVLQEGMYDDTNRLMQTALTGYGPEFIELLKRMAAKEKNHQDRRLLGEMLKLTQSQQPLVSVNVDNSDRSQNLTINNNGNGLPSFGNSVKRAEEGIRTSLPPVHQKQLEEGEQNYIEAEFSDTKEEEILIEIDPIKRIEDELLTSAKEL